MNSMDSSIQSSDCSVLLKRLDDLKQENSSLRCILISDPDMNPLMKSKSSTFLERHLEIQKKRNEVVPTDRDSLVKQLSSIRHQKTNLFKEVESMREDNDDVYNTIDIITKEKKSLSEERDKIQDEIDVCKSVIDFLLKERDQMKKEMEIKNAKLAEYYLSIERHGDFIITAQNPVRHIRYKGMEVLTNHKPSSS